MPAPSQLVVAVDGPSGSGKSSVCREVARRLGLRYLDTGAMYRALTWWALDKDADLDDAETLARMARELPLDIGTSPDSTLLTVGGSDVSAAIREPRISAAVSAVATNLGVREELVRRQREIAAEDGGIVVEGRDIGSVVAPDAAAKAYLTADPEARAARRTAENGAGDVAATQADLLRRDCIDSGRTTAPAVMPDGAVHLDTTPYTLDEVIDQVVALVEAASRVEQGSTP